MKRTLLLVLCALLPAHVACDSSPRIHDGDEAPDASHRAADAGVDAGPPLTRAGSACARDADCGEGFSCDTLVPGGYCLPGAPGGPTACREPEQGCPAGTVCSPRPWSAISGVCMRACATTADCRSGLVCDVVELFPGDPSSPRSPSPVCWMPKPMCRVGFDDSCNDNPAISSIHGTCQPDGSCKCAEGYAKNPATGRCL